MGLGNHRQICLSTSQTLVSAESTHYLRDTDAPRSGRGGIVRCAGRRPRPVRHKRRTASRQRSGAGARPPRMLCPHCNGSDLVGEFCNCGHLDSMQPQKQLSLHSISSAVLVGLVISHVATSNGDRDREHLFQITGY